MTAHRDAATGKYVTAEYAETNPDTTVSEQRTRRGYGVLDELDRLRSVVHTQRVAIEGYREEVERLKAAEPIVRTVGDLTARHVGRRVRLDEHYDGTLVDIFAHEGRVALNFTHPDGFSLGCVRPLDTPCEVLS